MSSVVAVNEEERVSGVDQAASSWALGNGPALAVSAEQEPVLSGARVVGARGPSGALSS